MKKNLFTLAIASILFSLAGCDDTTEYPGKKPAPPRDPKGDAAEYTLRQVLQYDPVNVNGVNIIDELDFFGDLKFTLQLVDGKATTLEFSNGSVPFFPYGFDAPDGKIECVIDTDVEPNAIRIKGTGEVFATLDRGEIAIPFRLGSSLVSYKYTFRTVE